VPSLAGATGPLLARLEARAAAAPADAEGPAHGTFRPAQVLLNHGHIGFIDFDSFCAAEPALDVALFLEKIRDLGLSASTGDDDEDDAPLDPALYPARLAAVQRLCATFLDAYSAHRPISRERVALWETLYLLTLVLHCWTKVKPARLVHSMVLLDDHLRANNLAAGAPVSQ
jgi:Ser/Thr protein kinase RdoA (MazF antagonist)